MSRVYTLAVCLTLVGTSSVAAQCIKASIISSALLVCQNEADRPTSGNTLGDLAVTADTQRLWIADSPTTWALVGPVAAGSTEWGAITGTLSDQTDLQTVLDSKGTSNFSGAYADLTGKPTLGSAAATASTDYATAAQGTTAESALQPTGNGSQLTSLTKAQVGLGNVENTSDAAKPISIATQTALDAKLATNGNGSSLTGLTKTQVGLANVDNTADANKNVSSAATFTTPRTINGVSFNGSANITVTAAGSTLSDNVPVTKLNSGTGASATTFWRGDATWATPAGGSGPTLLRVTADVSNSTLNFADVTGLTMAVTSGTTYRFDCPLTYTTAVSTTALQLSVNGPAMTALDYAVLTSTTATAMHSAAQTAVDTVTNPATGGGATRLPVTISGSFIPSANGTFALRLRSEVNTSAVVVKRGSWCAVY